MPLNGILESKLLACQKPFLKFLIHILNDFPGRFYQFVITSTLFFHVYILVFAHLLLVRTSLFRAVLGSQKSSVESRVRKHSLPTAPAPTIGVPHQVAFSVDNEPEYTCPYHTGSEAYIRGQSLYHVLDKRVVMYITQHRTE